MAEQFKQESEKFSAQLTKKGRSKEEKIGRLKYNQYLLKRALSAIETVREMQRIILNGPKGAGYFHFDVPLLQKYACKGQVDLEILELLYQAGREGVLPKDVAARLPEYHLKQYQVTRRIQRMNKRLECETGERLFEKRGWKWVLTGFAFEIWGAVDKGEIAQA